MVGIHKHLVSHVQHDLVSVHCFFTWSVGMWLNTWRYLYMKHIHCNYSRVLASYTGLHAAAISNFILRKC